MVKNSFAQKLRVNIEAFFLTKQIKIYSMYFYFFKVLELENSNEQAISFLEKMNQLQNENTILRDKNDELSLELENLTLK